MKVVVKEEKRVYDGFFKINEASLQHERFDGSMSPEMKRLNFERGDAVAALLFNTDTQKVILTHQFRYPTHTKGDSWLVEIVAGGIAPEEDPETALKREIVEEVGYEVTKLEHYQSCYMSPGGSSERLYIYYAETDNAHKVSEGGGVANENEDIAIIEWTIEELESALRHGALCDAKTLIAVLSFLKERA